MQASFTSMWMAVDGMRVLGVFADRAEAALAGEPREIAVRQLTGSPETDGCVWQAEGIWGTVTMAAGELRAEHCSVGPSWGANPQSAIAGLCGATCDRRGVELTALRCWPIGQIPAEEPENLARTWPFDTIIHRAMPTLPDLQEALAEDYPALYRRSLEADEELQAKRGSEALELLTEKLVRIGCRRWLDSPTEEGLTLRRAERVTERKLCHELTLREMEILCVLLKLQESPEITSRLDNGEITREECAALRERLKPLVPRVRSPLGRRAYIEE